MKSVSKIQIKEQIEDLLNQYEWCSYLVVAHKMGKILKAIPVKEKPNVEVAMFKLKVDFNKNIGVEFEVYENR